MTRTTTPLPTFTLDTSGFVDMRDYASHEKRVFPQMIWSDLDPFTQGYIEALFASVFTPFEPQGENPFRLRDPKRWRFVGFSDLAPEALALILKDCAAILGSRGVTDGANIQTGRNTWNLRQRGYWASEGFPPLTPYLRDDGKVDLKESTPR